MYKCILYMLMLQPEIWDWSIYCKIEDDLLGGFTLTIFGIRDMDGYCFFLKLSHSLSFETLLDSLTIPFTHNNDPTIGGYLFDLEKKIIVLLVEGLSKVYLIVRGYVFNVQPCCGGLSLMTSSFFLGFRKINQPAGWVVQRSGKTW